MDAPTLQSFREEFTKRAEWKRDDERQAASFEATRKKQKERKADQDKDGEEQEGMLFTVVLATETEVAELAATVDLYQEATVEALMENEQQLTDVRAELKLLLDKAYVLPDGRRVFKTEDGLRVFDEHGVEVEDVDPDTIEDWRPYWNQYQNPYERERTLVDRNEDLHEFQALTDNIDDEIARGSMTQERLDEIGQLLGEKAPDAVKRRVLEKEDPAVEDATPAPDLSGIRPIKIDLSSM